MAKSVLLIDDDTLILDFFENFLKRSNFTVLKAQKGEEGLRVYKEETPDLVFLDISLPDISGIAILEEIKKINPEAKVIMVTGLIQADLKERAEALGAKDFLYKPVTFSTLKEKIAKFL